MPPRSLAAAVLQQQRRRRVAFHSQQLPRLLASALATRSCTSVCIVTDLTPPQLKAFLELLDTEAVARDIASYRHPHLVRANGAAQRSACAAAVAALDT
jgi:hypothetical protein